MSGLSLASGRSVLQDKLSGPRKFLGLASQHGMLRFGFILVAIVVVAAVGAPLLAPYDPLEISAQDRFLPPSLAHPMGTDEYGRDLFSRILYGARLSLLVGLSVATCSIVAGGSLGALAGFFPRLDAPIMRVMDTFMALPSVILALGIMAILGPGLVNGIIALILVDTPRTARIVRSAILSLKEQEFVSAARALGRRETSILFRHLIPNTMSVLLVHASFVFAVAIQIEAVLSFLGLGAAPPTPTWGNILAAGRFYIREAAWYITFPGVALSIIVLGLNLLGDGLRDILDPYAKQLLSKREPQ